MKKTIIIIVALAVVGFGIYYIVSKPTPVVPVSNNLTASTTENIISIKNFSFNPSTLTVKAGTKVTWINNDNVSHTVTSDTMDPGNFLNSGILSPGQSFSFIFTSPVSVGYHCNIHPMMKGDVIIDVIVGN